MMALDVLCFGEVIIDFVPEQAGRRLRHVDRFARHLGGAPANVAVGLARLGAAAGLMTLVGDDEFGAFLRAALEREGVDVAAVGVHATARTGIAFVSLGPRGERSLLFYRHPSADQLIGEGDVDPAALRRARAFHDGSSTLSAQPARAATRKALREARAAGLVISADPNLRPDLSHNRFGCSRNSRRRWLRHSSQHCRLEWQEWFDRTRAPSQLGQGCTCGGHAPVACGSPEPILHTVAGGPGASAKLETPTSGCQLVPSRPTSIRP